MRSTPKESALIADTDPCTRVSENSWTDKHGGKELSIHPLTGFTPRRRYWPRWVVGKTAATPNHQMLLRQGRHSTTCPVQQIKRTHAKGQVTTLILGVSQRPTHSSSRHTSASLSAPLSPTLLRRAHNIAWALRTYTMPHLPGPPLPSREAPARVDDLHT